MRRPCAALLALVALAGTTALAQEVVTTRHPTIFATEATGGQHRDAVNRAVELASAGDAAGAMDAVGPALAYCGAQLARTGIRFVSVASQAQYERFLAEHGDGTPLEWLDVACPGAYTLAGFVHAGEKRMEAALPLLEQAAEIAPYDPRPRTELGFVLNQLGRHQDAIAVYREVIALSEQDDSAAHATGMALRGIGWALVELGDLDAAERAYRDSLEADPDNGLAQRELEYIGAQRRARAPSAAAE